MLSPLSQPSQENNKGFALRVLNNYNYCKPGFSLRFEIARTTVVMTGTKTGGRAPSWDTVPSQSRCEMGPAPLWVYGASSKIVFYILRPRGCILDMFWPIRLSVLALLRKAFAA